jgi:ABC-type phosphate/phosphonate transport system permease subunit
MDPNGPTSPTDELVASTVPALTWARVLLVAKQHGIVGALCALMIYQMGLLASAQNYMCGV